MELLKTLAVALSLGSLAGINLYLTVFVTGLAVRFDWITLPPPLQGLEVLGHPVLIGIAGTLYLIEFFADKVPWIDSAWDSVHTFIRPVGAAALAITAVGDAHPVFEVAAALLAGGMALTSHTAKAGTRLAANSSPEPVTNIGLSLVEDGVVLGALALLAWNPLAVLAIALVFTATVLFTLPRLLRAIRLKLWLAWKKLAGLPAVKRPREPRHALPHRWESLLRRSLPGKPDVTWAIPCVSVKGALLRPNIFGWLIGLESDPPEACFLGKTWRGPIFAVIDLRGATAETTDGFMAATIEITTGQQRQAFLVEKNLSTAAAKVADLVSDAGATPETRQDDAY
jgi:hypothetical protein